MNLLKKKNGYSLAFALTLFLLATILGVTILTAASVASGRIAGIEKGESSYYISTSVFKYINDAIGGGEIRYDTTATRSENLSALSSNELKEFIVDAFSNVTSNGTDHEDEITFSFTSGGGALYTVYLTGTMSSFNYDMTFTINRITETRSAAETDMLMPHIKTISFSSEEIEHIGVAVIIVTYQEGKLL